MTRSSALTRRTLAALAAAALTVTGLAGAGAASAAPGHTTVVTDVPSTASPDITDGTVFAIHDAGSKIIAAGPAVDGNDWRARAASVGP